MKLNPLLLSLLLTPSAFGAVSFNLEFQFGLDTSIPTTGVGYLVVTAGATNLNSLSGLSFADNTAGSFSTALASSGYEVISVASNAVDGGTLDPTFSGDGFFGLGNTSYNLPSFDTGDKLGFVWTNGSDVIGYNGATTAATTSGANIGWELPADIATVTLADFVIDGGAPGARVNSADFATIGTVAPEPSSALLSLGGLALLGLRRKR